MSFNNEDPVGCALRNQLVLQEIFNFLPMESLLTASRVNKFWCAEARTYIRDHRKCTVGIRSTGTLVPCEQLQKLDQDLAQMSNVPFNSLRIHLESHLEPQQKQQQNPSSHFGYENMISKLNPKYLELSLSGEDVGACPVTSLILRFLTEKSGQLISLDFDEISPFFIRLLSVTDCQLRFPQLLELQICDMGDWLKSDDRRVKDLLQKVLDGAPRLERIIHSGDLKLLDLLPESKYNLLSTCSFFGSNTGIEDIQQMRKLCQSEPKISELTAYFQNRWDPVQSHLFSSLVQSCSSSLKILEICRRIPLKDVLEFPPLPKLTELRVTFFIEDPSVDFVEEFQSVQFQRLFPQLKNVVLAEEDAEFKQCWEHSDVDMDANYFNPDSPFACKTLTNLDIHLDICSHGLLQLMKTFPSLENFKISGFRRTSRTFPYRDMFRFWSNLKTIAIDGFVCDRNDLQNRDAEFCGISKKEVKLLWNMGEEYLKKVHIVPVRPCLSTMKGMLARRVVSRLALDLQQLAMLTQFSWVFHI